MRKAEKRRLGEERAKKAAEESRRIGLLALEKDRKRRADAEEQAKKDALKAKQDTKKEASKQKTLQNIAGN